MSSRSLLDTNVLVYAFFDQAPMHAAAAALVDRALTRPGRYCIAPQNLVEFAAVASRTRFVSNPMSTTDLGRILDTLYRSRRLAKIYPARGTVMRAVREGLALGLQGPVWYDIFLAATMRDAGVDLIVTENTADFAKFPFISAVSITRAAAP